MTGLEPVPEEIRICVDHCIVAVAFHLSAEQIKHVVEIRRVHLEFLETLPLLEVVSDREIDLFALQGFCKLCAVLFHELFCIVDTVIVNTNEKSGCLSLLVIILKLGVDAEFAVVVDGHTEYDEMASCILYLLEVDVALIFGYVDADKGISGLIFALEIGKRRLFGLRCACTAGLAGRRSRFLRGCGLLGVNLDRNVNGLAVAGIVSDRHLDRIIANGIIVHLAGNL